MIMPIQRVTVLLGLIIALSAVAMDAAPPPQEQEPQPTWNGQPVDTRKIYYDEVFDPMLALRMQNPSGWYQQMPTLHDTVKQKYGPELFAKIMKHGQMYPQ